MDCVLSLIQECDVDLQREDGKGQNLINYAYKYKRFPLIDILMEAGVPCPRDIAQKLTLQKQKVPRKIEETIQQPLQEEPAQHYELIKKPLIPQPKGAISSTFTSTQLKEILKQSQENKLSKKYCLTVFKDGIYQEVNQEEFKEF